MNVRRMLVAIPMAIALVAANTPESGCQSDTGKDYGEMRIHIYFEGRQAQQLGTEIRYRWDNDAPQIQQLHPGEKREDDWIDRAPHIQGKKNFTVAVLTTVPVKDDGKAGAKVAYGCEVEIVHTNGKKDVKVHVEGDLSFRPTVTCVLNNIDYGK